MWLSSPVSLRTLTHDTTDADQTFSETRWLSICSSLSGAVLTFSTSQAFANTTDPSKKRDARLSIRRMFGSNNWTINVPTDQTDYAAAVPKEVATVKATSSSPAFTFWGLTATFITDDFSTLAAGTYETAAAR